MMNFLPLVGSVVGVLGLQVGGMDMAVIEKWSSARTVKYRAQGVHNARVAVVYGDYEGKADVIDRITVEFTFDVRKGEIVGPVVITDGKSEIKNLESDGTNCPPPQLNGQYEHFSSVSHSMASPEQIQITGTRTYPPANVSNYPGGCSMRPIPGAKVEALQWVLGTAPEALGLPIMKGAPISVAADRKSFSVPSAENWVWTYTPTLVQ
jgi:hypothetical protein